MGLGQEILRIAASVIAQKIISSRGDGKSKTPRGYANRLLEESKKSLPGLNMNLMNYSIRKLKADKPEHSFIAISPDETMISSLTGDKSSTRSTSSARCNFISLLDDNTTIDTEAVNNPDDNNPTEIDGYNTTIDTEAANNPDDNNPAEIDGYTTKSSIGRHKGSTSSFYMDLKERIELATREAVKRLEAEKRKKRSSKARLSKGLLDIIIAAAKDKCAIPDDLELNKVTIRKRVE